MPGVNEGTPVELPAASRTPPQPEIPDLPADSRPWIPVIPVEAGRTGRLPLGADGGAGARPVRGSNRYQSVVLGLGGHPKPATTPLSDRDVDAGEDRMVPRWQEQRLGSREAAATSGARATRLDAPAQTCALDRHTSSRLYGNFFVSSCSLGRRLDLEVWSWPALIRNAFACACNAASTPGSKVAA
jgi:hypothetical protein